MEESLTKEKILKRLRQSILSKTPHPYPNLDMESNVYIVNNEDLIINFARNLTEAGGQIIYCENQVEFLEELLLKNNFTLLFISHDRYFIDNIATNVIEVDGGELRKFNGGYSSYLEQKSQILSNLQKEHENLLRLVKQEAHWMQHGVTARRKRNERRKSEYFVEMYDTQIQYRGGGHF